MTKNYIRLFIVFIFVFVLTKVNAQEILSTSGNNAAGGSGTVTYTVGQIVYSTIIGESGSLAQGVQQAYEITVISGFEHKKDIKLMCKAYPNPTVDNLILEIANYESDNLTYQLVDVNGKLIQTKKITVNETDIYMNNCAVGVYFLKLSSNCNPIKTFKIIKQ
ncbi:MAG: T9SS type A sorting domain-containing protein [Bacteroidales bacterium]|nr:T9SS type A sorting domain-containing protein [Bacteroidales bacterium]